MTTQASPSRTGQRRTRNGDRLPDRSGIHEWQKTRGTLHRRCQHCHESDSLVGHQLHDHRDGRSHGEPNQHVDFARRGDAGALMVIGREFCASGSMGKLDQRAAQEEQG